MPRWVLILIVLAVLALSYVSGKNYAERKALQKEMDAKIGAFDNRLKAISQHYDSTLAAYRIHNTTEAARIKKIDSAIQSYQNDIKSLQWSVNSLKRTRDDLQKDLDSLTSVISLPEL